MNGGMIESGASRLALMARVWGVMLCFGLSSQHAQAASTTNAQFYQYIFDICNAQTPPPTLDLAKLVSLCVNAFPGGPAGGGQQTTVSSNLGVASAAGGLSSSKKKRVQELSEDERKQNEKAASADGGGWGFLVAPQYSKLNRAETELENGYQAELTGLNVGLDYRFSDSFVLGGTVGQTKDKATFLNDAGSLKTTNNSFTMYGTWLVSERLAIDGYLGYSKLNLDSRRQVVFGPLISGAVTGSTSGNQTLAGLSTSYQMDAGGVNVSPFLNLDYVKTKFRGYEETGTTLLELRFSDRRTSSFSSSLGARLDTSSGYDWGALIPSARVAAVHEFQNDSQQISNELVLTPGTSMSVTTDAPDRNYLNIGVGVAAALNGGAQLFLDYEKRTQDKLLSSWAVSLGGLFEF